LTPPAKDRPVQGIGLRLARVLRRHPDAPQRVLIRHLPEAHIRAAGGTILATLGPVTAAIIRGKATALRLARDGGDLELPAPLRPMLDKSRVLVHADQTDYALGFTRHLRGSGAMVGIYDSGIELAHPDFRTLDGKTRIIKAWDQDTQERCDSARIDRGACPIGDEIGHGTHVASIALGNGPFFRGIAPEADLAIVRSTLFDGLVPALVFLDDAARERGVPLVVNLSLGGHVGPHDGTSPEAAAVDAFGHLVVVAAGNEGGDAVHAGATLSPGAVIDVALDFGVISAGLPLDGVVDVWGAPDATLAIALIAVKDGRVVWTSGALGPGTPGRTVPIAIEPGAPPLGEVELDAEPEKNRANGRPHVGLSITSTLSPGVTFAVRMAGSGRFDAWIDAPADIPRVPRFASAPTLGLASEILGNAELSLSDLAASRRAIAVSAMVSRTEVDGTQVNRGVIGELAAFSSHGPTLDPVRTGDKPELTAPGLSIVAAASRTGTEAPLYRVRAGTSMAVPHVAGAAAVLLGLARGASIDELRRWLTTTAAPPPDGDPRWGLGTLDVAAAAAAAGAPTEGCGCQTASGSPTWALMALCVALLRRTTFAPLTARRRLGRAEPSTSPLGLRP